MMMVMLNVFQLGVPGPNREQLTVVPLSGHEIIGEPGLVGPGDYRRTRRGRPRPVDHLGDPGLQSR